MSLPIYGAIEAGGTKFVVALATGPNEILARTTLPTTTPPETLAAVVAFLNQAEDKHGKLSSLGVASFGPIDLHLESPTYGYITSTPKAAWRQTNVLGVLKESFSVPMGFDTDVNGAALAECRWGAAQSVDSCLYITVGTGIGGGFACGGRTLQGLVHPEMGHVRIQQLPQDEFPGECPFHQNACVEGLASGPALEKRWGCPGHELPPEHEAWTLQVDYLAQALVNMIVVLSPECVVLGGGVMKQSHLFPPLRIRVRELLNGYLEAPQILEENQDYIVPPLLGDNAGLLGALALGMDAG